MLHQVGKLQENPLKIVQIPLPQPGPGQIRIRVEACAICHTDIHTVEGDIPLQKQPIIPGHQVIGTVDAMGENTRRFKLGERVGVPWLGWTCGRCFYCLRGDENLCEHARFTGYHIDGGYAEYIIAWEGFAHRIPEIFDAVTAAPLLCAGVIGYRALRLSQAKSGETLGLFGFGASAHIVIQVARYWGCKVFVISRGAQHRELARGLGASWTGTAEERPPHPMDRAIIFAPAGGLVPVALSMLRKGGTLAIAAIYLDQIPEMDYTDLIYGEKTIKSVTASTRRDAEELLKVAALIPVHSSIQTFDLEDANRALQMLKAGQIKGVGVLRIQS